MGERVRYIGTETEFAVDTNDSSNANRQLAYLTVKTAHASPEINHFNPGDFTTQGARFYLDTGEHPEYATPECLSAAEATLQELIGESYAIAAFQSAYNQLSENESEIFAPKEARLSKRTTDSQKDAEGDWLNATWGSHENYQVLRSAFENLGQDRIWQSMAAHQISRVIYTGSGGYLNGSYYISPRSQFHFSDFGSNTTVGRSLVNTRDEPLVKNVERWRRLHVITGDANISPWAIHMKLGTSALVFKAMEAGIHFDDLCPQKPVKAFMKFGQNTGLESAFTCNDGERRSALAIQSEILARLRPFVETSDEALVADEWAQALQALERLEKENKVCKFLYSIDWFARAQTIERKQSAKHSPEKLDYLYSQLSDQAGRLGSGQKLRESGLFRLTPDNWSLEPNPVPPQARRAQLRALVVDRIKASRPYLDNDLYKYTRHLFRTDWTDAIDTHRQLIRFPDQPSESEFANFCAFLDRTYPLPASYLAKNTALAPPEKQESYRRI